MDTVQHFSSPDRAISLIAGHYQSFEFERHYHLDYHFGLITKGQQQFKCAGETHRVGPGDIVVMPPDTLHDGSPAMQTGYHSHIFAVEPDWLSGFLAAPHFASELSFGKIVLKDPAIFAHLRSAHQSLRMVSLSQLAKDCLPYESFAPLVSRYGQAKQPQEKCLGRMTLRKLRDFLMANIAEPVRLTQLAELCDLSPTQFQRRFKSTVGMTPYAWFTRLRLEQALKLLKDQRSVTDVTFQVGFYDQAHFSKAFKQTFGLSPSEVR